jgi:nicotinate-nucleotide adenylyltransferase
VEFFRRAPLSPARLGILPGTFNPITIAHLALAQAALPHVDEVVFVLPQVLPHKQFEGASFAERLEMLQVALAEQPAVSIATSQGGLFAEIADECRAAYGDGVRLSFLCGRDAAERIAEWDYGKPGMFEEMLGGFDLLVASRGGDWVPRAEIERSVQVLPIPREVGAVSASEVRRRIARGEPWECLVPPAVIGIAGEIYRSRL